MTSSRPIATHSSLISLFYLLILRHNIFPLVQGAVYPNTPQSTPPLQWASMSSTFEQHCSPFGVSMFAQGWPEDKFVHVCNLLAQMLDNDQDGCADDTAVVETLRKFRTGMAMFETEEAVEKYADKIESSFRWQDLYASETEPTCSGKDETADCRDAAIEEIFHIVSGTGLSATYPEVFGECNVEGDKRSTMQVQMDIARGGHFNSVPISYPSKAIYHYDDKTCDYACMGTEFIYWAVTSALGGQNERAEMNTQEWEASTPTQLYQKLPGMYSLVIDGNTTSMIMLSNQGELPGSGGSIYGARETYKPSKQTCPLGCGLDGTGCGPVPDDVQSTCSLSSHVHLPDDIQSTSSLSSHIHHISTTYIIFLALFGLTFLQ